MLRNLPLVCRGQSLAGGDSQEMGAGCRHHGDCRGLTAKSVASGAGCSRTEPCALRSATTLMPKHGLGKAGVQITADNITMLVVSYLILVLIGSAQEER